MENVNEQGIQQEVGHGADEHREHAGLPEALGVDVGIHSHPGHDERRARQVHAEIGVGIGEGVRTGSRPPEHRRLDQVAQQGEGETHHQEHEIGVALDAAGLLLVLLSPGDGKEGRAAGGPKGLEGADDHEDGGRQADAREGQLPIRDMADVDPIHDAVQGVHQQGQGHGPGQPQNIPHQAPLGKIVLVPCRQEHSLLRIVCIQSISAFGR